MAGKHRKKDFAEYNRAPGVNQSIDPVAAAQFYGAISRAREELNDPIAKAQVYDALHRSIGNAPDPFSESTAAPVVPTILEPVPSTTEPFPTTTEPAPSYEYGVSYETELTTPEETPAENQQSAPEVPESTRHGFLRITPEAYGIDLETLTRLVAHLSPLLAAIGLRQAASDLRNAGEAPLLADWLDARALVLEASGDSA